VFYFDCTNTDRNLNSFMTLNLRNFFAYHIVWWISNMVVLLRMISVVSHFFGYNITGTFIYVILLVWHFLVQHACCVIVGVT